MNIANSQSKQRRRLYVNEAPYIDQKSIDPQEIDIHNPIGKLKYKNGSIKFKMRPHIMRDGGIWYTFMCDCGRGVYRLYFRNWKLACRHCHQLAYQSENCSKIDRSINQKWKYLRKLGCDNNYPIRSKWMKGHTFEKICEKIRRYDQTACAHFFK